MIIKSKIGFVLGIVAFVVLLVSFFLPWYQVSTETYFADGSPFNGKVSSEFYLDEWIQILTLGDSETTTHNGYNESESWTAVGDFMDTFSLILIIGIVLLVVSSLIALVGSKKVAIAFGLVALAVLIACILMFYTGIDEAVNESNAQTSNPIDGFSGSDSTDLILFQLTLEWGPMIGFWMLIVALVVQIGQVAAVAFSGFKVRV